MQPQVVIASHRRSGTHLTLDAIVNNFKAFRNSIDAEDAFFERLRGEDARGRMEIYRAAVESRGNVFFTHMHDTRALDLYFRNDPDSAGLLADILGHSKIIYVYRDGRDVQVSQYHWMKNQPDSGVEGVPFGAYLRMDNEWDCESYDGDYNRAAFWRYHVEGWRSRSDVLHMRFEDFHSDFEGCLQQIEEFTGFEREPTVINTRRKPFLGFLSYGKWTRRFRKYVVAPLTGAKSQAHFFRSGRVGDFRSTFSEEDLEFFSQQSGNLLHDLGYAA